MGIRPGTPVAIRARTSFGGQGTFISEARFVADERGTVDVATATSHRGTYQGVDPMGLFWSMHLDTAARMAPESAHPWAPPAPYAVELEAIVESSVVARTTLLRQFLAPSVTRQDLHNGGVEGHFFLPAPIDSARAPLVIVLGGSEGGFDDLRAAMLASHGFATLALAYFRAPGLPEELFEIPIETVERAVRWAGHQPSLTPGRIAILGTSKGAELALTAASLVPEIHAVVSIVGTESVGQGIDRNGRSRAVSSWTWRGHPLPFVRQVPPPEFTAQFTQHGPPYRLRPLFENSRRDSASLRSAMIPVERIQGPILLISGDDDQMGTSVESGAVVVRRLEAAHSPYLARHLRYPNAGHAIQLPFLPTPPRVGLGQFWAMGGTDVGYARADAASWENILAFLEGALRH